VESLVAQPSPPIRASDEDRERTVAILREHFHAGRLDTEEFEARCEEAWGSRMISNLWHAVRELPLAPPAAAAPDPARGANSAVAGFVASLLAACLLVITFGVASFATAPISGLGWWLGRRGQKRGVDHPQRGLATAAQVIGLLGLLLGLLAIYVWLHVFAASNGSF
jgi:DUF1707 SHOCT-like domain